MTTPAQDAPLVFPSVAFRPVRLFVTSLVLTVVAIAVAAWLGHPMVGVFFGVGLLLGLLNAARRAAFGGGHHRGCASAEKEDGAELRDAVAGHHRRSDWLIAFIFRPAGLGVVFGLALFQVLLVLIDRVAGDEEAAYRGTADAIEGTGNSND